MNDTESEVIKDILSRQKRGKKKYGTTVAGNPLSLKEWLQHAYEESLDQAIYLRRAVQEIQKREILTAGVCLCCGHPWRKDKGYVCGGCPGCTINETGCGCNPHDA